MEMLLCPDCIMEGAGEDAETMERFACSNPRGCDMCYRWRSNERHPVLTLVTWLEEEVQPR